MLRSIQDKLSETVFLNSKALSLFRIGLGLVLLMDLILRLSFLQLHYSDSGAFSIELMRQIRWEKWYFSIHAFSGSVYFQYFLFALAAMAALGLILGYRTRTTLIISWILLVSLQNRNQLVLNAGDTLLRMIIFWSIFLPLDNHFTVSKRKVQEQIYLLPALGFMLQLFFVYFSASVFKLNGVWQQGEAMQRIFSQNELLSRLGILCQPFSESVDILNYMIVYSQAILPLLFFIPFRKYLLREIAIVVLFLFHVAIAMLFDLGIFPYVNMVALIALLPMSRLSINEIVFPKLEISGLGWIRDVIFALLIFVMIVVNLQSYSLLHVNRIFNPLIMALRLDQQWNMFDDNSLGKKLELQTKYVLPDGTVVPVEAITGKNIRSKYFNSYLPFVKQESLRERNVACLCETYYGRLSVLPESVSIDAQLMRVHRNRETSIEFEFHKIYPCK